MRKEKSIKGVLTMEEMLRLISQLNAATRSYDTGHPKMSDSQWDWLYFQLVKLEQETGVVLPESPTHTLLNSIALCEKQEHNHPMLSLDKTKEISTIQTFVSGPQSVIAMCKMDGLTCSLTYNNGVLTRAETRGNGYIGDNVLPNIWNIAPRYLERSPSGEFTVDGEVICTYEAFKPFSTQYSNPRNFAAGSLRLINPDESAIRNLTFVAWDLIKPTNLFATLTEKLQYLQELGFNTVPFISPVSSNREDIEDVIERLRITAQELSYPIDGIVFKYDSVDYYYACGATSHHFRGGIAFKFYDETYPTKLLNIEWTMGRTGVLTPVAIFEPIEIDGAIIERASLHNVSIMYELLGIYPFVGQVLNIYRANQIIPQVYDSEQSNEQIAARDYLIIPTTCPICGGQVELVVNNDTTSLVCANPDCEGKLVNKLDHFCGKKGLDIRGLSKNTLDKLVDWGWVDSYESLFSLKDHRKEWQAKPGFGIKSVDNILAAIEAARNTTLPQFLSAIAIPLIGLTYSKNLADLFKTYPDFRKAIQEDYDFSSIPGFGEAMHQAIISFDYSSADALYELKHIIIKEEKPVEKTADFENIIFVVTGKLKTFKNRDEIVKVIESKGGKVASSVTTKTTYLINNDINSNSAKNQTAKKLGIKIITEEEFLHL